MIAPPGADPREYADRYYFSLSQGVPADQIDLALWPNYGFDYSSYQGMTPEEQISWFQLQSELSTRRQNQDAVLGAYGDITAGQQTASDTALTADLQRLQMEDAARTAAWTSDVGSYRDLATSEAQTSAEQDATLALLTQLYGQTATAEQVGTAYLGQAANDANTRAYTFLGQVEGAMDDANRYDASALDLMGDQYGEALNMGEAGVIDAYRLNAAIQGGQTPWGIDGGEFQPWQDISSQAALAGADPADVAAQREALARMLGASEQAAALGSEAANAQADYGAVQNQSDAMAMWRRYAGFDDRSDGGEGGPTGEPPIDDIMSREAIAYADQEAVNAQKQALRDMYGLTSGELTATERFNMEQARRAEERDRLATMASLQRDLRERGVGGSGAEVSGLLGAQQQTSENRMLQDLASLAQAQQRQERMLGQYAGLAGDIRTQSFGEEARRGEAWDEMALRNRANRMSALGQMTDLSSGMRGQSFEEAFRRGEATDRMNLAGQENQLQALGLYGDLSTTMRGQGFEEQYQTGQAADLFARFNAENSESQQRWLAEYNRQLDEQAWARQAELSRLQQSEADRQWGVTTDYANTQRDVGGDQFARDQYLWSTAFDENQQAYARQGDVYSAMTGATGRTYDRGSDLGDTYLQASTADYGRQQDLSQLGLGITGTTYARSTDYLDSLRQATADYYNREQDRQNDVMNITQLYTSGNQAAQAGVSQAYQTQLGQRNADEAMQALTESTGLLDDDIPLLGLL